MTALADLRRHVWQVNEDHGWHEKERTWPEIRMLVVSELAEALEEYRAGRMDTWLNPERKFKPEGFWIEVADAAIRLMDWAETRGLYWDEGDAVFVLRGAVEKPRGFYTMNPVEQLDAVTVVLHDSGQFSDDSLVWLGLSACFALAIAHKRDLLDLITLKLEYNKTRPYRHGGKVA